MDRAFYVDAIAMSERHVAQCQKHITGQRRIIAKIDARGKDSTEANVLLAIFLETLQIRETNRQWFIDRIAKHDNNFLSKA